MLRVTGLCKSYHQADRRQSLLQGVDLDLDAGQVAMLLGPSGSGKSTLLNLLAGIEPSDAGKIQLDDTELTALDEPGRTRLRRRRIGVIYQFFNLVPTLTVWENVLLPLALNGRLAEQGRAVDQLRQLGLYELKSRFPEQLSGGEQQRAAICRALIHQPALVLADEPTGSLDADSAETVVQLLLEQVRAGNQALLMVTHSEPLTRHADRVWRLQQGRLEVER
ncbi:ABC transporter ATP-binding protein [Marinobacterium arenosum]|uniref:ABC transporter ATP-binding protein n=1 Tax=Marinobacterium arenosum TaxID=2862496 RepID=UPI001C948412|nr:ABC transporter ATP-binding protein [Marinobacterium arenosum]MBY4678699.1 ABC transporter ATP-binding protein [Marinobacterium arenosum]